MTRTSVRLPAKMFVVVGVLVAGATLVYAANSAREAAVAARHAVLASKAANLKVVHTHLHHVVNCLVGPKGEGFDSGAANPCAALGNGAIPDATDAAMKATLMKALETANAGLGSNDLQAAQKDASETAAILEEVK